MQNKVNSKDVAVCMEKITRNSGNEELVFDPRTGALTVVGPHGLIDRDTVPATEMAREGFF